MECRLAEFNVLLSFAYHPRAALIQRYLDAGARVMLDSGAFTAFASGKPIDLAAYHAYLAHMPLSSTRFKYLALDVIGDPAATRVNYDKMVAAGFAPVPVIQPGAPLDDARYYAERAPLVCFGGLVGRSPAEVMRRVQAYLPAIGDTPYHLLGTTGSALSLTLGPASVDASSWKSSGRYGSCSLYLGGGRIKAINKEALVGPHAAQIARRIVLTGYDPRVLLAEKAWRGGVSPVMELSAASWMAYGDDLYAKCGTIVYLAGGESNHENLFQAWERRRNA